MNPLLGDAAGLGLAFWLIGYILGIVLFLTPFAPVMGWVLFVCLTPVMVFVTFRWFSRRSLPLSYFVQLAVAWTAIAVVLDDLFIVLLFHPAAYYQPDVLVSYAVTFLVPVCTGWYLQEHRPAPLS
jgi:hypothetical protein